MARTVAQIDSKLKSVRSKIAKLSKRDAKRFRLEVDRDILKLEKMKLMLKRRSK